MEILLDKSISLVAPLCVLLLFMLSGCMSLQSVSVEHMHVSHPLLGWPLGPSDEEDTLDTLGVTARWTRGRCYAEAGLGQQLADSGFYGDGFIFSSRIGLNLWERK